jgi:hypothetical protein
MEGSHMKMRMLVLSLAMASMTSAAFGGTIDFNTLTGTNLDPFSTYTENGFTVDSTTGQWFKAFLYGNPIPDIFLGPIGAITPGSVTITDGGGLFSFTSVDFSTNNGTSDYTIEGFKLGVSQFVESGTDSVNSSFVTVPTTSSAMIDMLVISINPTGGPTSFNLDNVAYTTTATPEPGTLSLLLLAAGSAGIRLKRALSRRT